MVRPQLTSVVLGEEHREVIAKRVGPEGQGAYIRDLILADNPSNETTKEELLISKNRALDAIIQEQAKELEILKKLVGKREKVSEAKDAEVRRAYATWHSVNREGKGVNAHREYFIGLGRMVDMKPRAIEELLFPEGLTMESLQ